MSPCLTAGSTFDIAIAENQSDDSHVASKLRTYLASQTFTVS